MPLLFHPDSTIEFENHHVPYIVSFLPLGCVPGSIIGWVLGDRFGRHRLILWLSVPFLATDLLIAFATHVNHLLLARFIMGLTIGAIYTVVPVYITEIASTEIRGKLSTALTLCNAFGMFYQYAVAPHLAISTNALICSILPVVMFVMLLTIPESPYFLVMKNREDAAKRSLIRLRNSSKIGAEFKRIQKGVEEDLEEKSSPLDIFKVGNLRPLGIILFSFFLQQGCGIIIAVSYSQLLFTQTGTELSINFCGSMIGLFGIPSALLSARFIEKYGRIQIFKYSCYLLGIDHFVIFTFFYFQSQGFDVSSFSMFPVVAIMIFKSFFFAGLGTVPYLFSVELMPTSLRAITTCFFSMVSSSIAVGTVFFYDKSKFYFGDFFPFGVFCLICISGAIAAKYVLFETKGKTLEEIQEKFSSKINQLPKV